MAIFMTAFGAAADTPGEHGVDPAPAVTVVEECGIVNPFDHYRAHYGDRALRRHIEKVIRHYGDCADHYPESGEARIAEERAEQGEAGKVEDIAFQLGRPGEDRKEEVGKGEDHRQHSDQEDVNADGPPNACEAAW